MAALVASMGVINLLWAVTPSLPSRMAWMLTMVCLVFSFIFNLIKGFDVEESLFAVVLLVILTATRKVYTARSDAPSIAQGAKALLASGLLTLAYGTADPAHVLCTG